jgi:glutamate formiminotransferase/formiminotetrahydrofolate cyclodeaminase
MRQGNPASITDAMVGIQMGFAGLRGGIWNVIINLKDITDSVFTADMENRCNQLLAEAKLVLDESMNYGDAKLTEMLAKKK